MNEEEVPSKNQKRYDNFVKRYEKAITRCAALGEERTRRTDRDRELHIFIESLRNQPLVLDAWDDHLWISLVKIGTVQHDGSIVFRFVNGTEITV